MSSQIQQTCPEQRLDSFSRYLVSPVVQIVAGEEKESMYAHTELLLSSESPSLRTLLCGDWSEMQSQVIDWSEVDAATIKRFLTFLYQGDYVVPDPEPLQVEQKSDNQPLPNQNSKPSHPFASLSFPTSTIEPLDELEDYSQFPFQWATGGPHYQDSSTSQNATADSYEPRPLTPISKCLGIGLPPESIRTTAGHLKEDSLSSSAHHYGATLLAHAQVYVFARYHLVERLQVFSLQRLTQVLRCVDCTQPHAISDLTPLVRYVYDNTVPFELREEPIRRLVSQFVAIHYTDLMRGELQDFFAGGGDFTLDISQKIARRLGASGGSTSLLEEQIENLERQTRDLRSTAQDSEDRLRQARRQLVEWENWGRGTSKKGRKRN